MDILDGYIMYLSDQVHEQVRPCRRPRPRPLYSFFILYEHQD